MGEIRVGTAGWTDKSLIESGWYPDGATNPEQRLRYYAGQFPRVEVDSAYYALPEASRGIFVGGGASVRLSRIIGVDRMMDLMLTGRVLSADEGQQLGVSQYLVDDGDGLDQALALAERIASNSPVSNFAVLQALPRIAEMGPSEGLFVEALMAAITQSSDESKSRMQDFLAGRAAKVVAHEQDD